MKKPIKTELYLQDLCEDDIYYGIMNGDEAIREELIINKEEYVAYVNGVTRDGDFGGAGDWKLLGLILAKDDIHLFSQLLPVLDFNQKDRYSATFLQYCIEEGSPDFVRLILNHIKVNDIPFSLWGGSTTEVLYNKDNVAGLHYNRLLCRIINSDNDVGLSVLPLIEGDDSMELCRKYLNFCFFGGASVGVSADTLNWIGSYMKEINIDFKEIKSNFLALASVYDKDLMKSLPNYNSTTGVSDEFFEELYLMYEIKKNSVNDNKRSLKI